MPLPPLPRRNLLGAGLGGLAGAVLVGDTARAVPATPTAPTGSTGATGAAGATNAAAARARVTTGAQRLAGEGWSSLTGTRLGIITNPTGTLADLTHLVDAMAATPGVTIAGVFGPEHGFRGTAQAGASEGTSTDPRTGLTVYDAYGAKATDLEARFREARVETVVFDIQDVGARFYTYVWTMYHAMHAAARLGLRFVVLDRPNPVGGAARGPMLTAAYATGVGLKPIAMQHGMTVGELARFFNAELLPKEDGAPRVPQLDVVVASGWRRRHLWADTGLPWVMPSPNMPTPDTALLYPGTGLFEGTVLSEGRGTTRPFELIGAPFVDHRWAAALNDRGLRGVRLREAYFTPTFGKHKDAVCGGVQVHITDRDRVDAIAVAAHMLVEAKRLYPGFAWRADSYDAARPYWVDKLSGSARLRTMVDSGASADECLAAWRDELAAFERARRPHLLYR